VIGTILLNFAFAALQSNFAVYSDARFGFTAADNAYVFAFIGLMAVFTQGFLIRKLMPRFGEGRLAVVGMTLMTISFVLTVIAPQAWMLFPIMGLLALGSGMATPSITSLISRRVTGKEQGATLGGTQALTSLTMVAGPLVAGYIFGAVGMTAPYALGAILLVVATAIIAAAVRSDLTAPIVPSVASVVQVAD
jgi:MFS transporter, DHA1 family, tetracycline resistance protein